jgi:uncharacterized protein YegP (UPF0339 family)
VATPDFTPPAIAAFVMLVITNLIVLLGVDISDTKKAAIAGLVNAVVIVGFLVHDAMDPPRSRPGRRRARAQPRRRAGRPPMSTTDAEFYIDADGTHRWRVQAANGKIVASSSEGFDTRAGAEENFRLVESFDDHPAEEADEQA